VFQPIPDELEKTVNEAKKKLMDDKKAKTEATASILAAASSTPAPSSNTGTPDVQYHRGDTDVIKDALARVKAAEERRTGVSEGDGGKKKSSMEGGKSDIR